MTDIIDTQKILGEGFELVSAESPSNIALIKYWGKLAGQIPMNPSISYTLDKCKTTFDVYFKKAESPQFEFYFEGKLGLEFGKKSKKLIELISKDYPELNQLHLILNSKNSFPHSSGIASSASSMSALALCLLSILGQSENLNLVSHYARLGSGSACRSLFSPMASWGKNFLGDDFSDEYATEISSGISKELRNIGDSIVLVHEGKKDVSSTKGHALMDDHPFREKRIQNANENYKKLINSLKVGDIKTWGEIIEAEALELHAMMMTSTPGYLLMKPKTLEVIEVVRKIRKEFNVNTYFTLDAGPNVHILYPLSERDQVLSLLDKELSLFKIIHDQVGPAGRLLERKSC